LFVSSRLRLGLALASALAFASGCTSLALVDPSKPIELASDEGLVIVHTVSTLQIERLDMDGVPVLANVPRGISFRIFKAKAGEHRFSRVILEAASRTEWGRGFRYVRFDGLEANPRYGTFRVEAGKLNYPGQIHLDATERGYYFEIAWVAIHNRSAVAWMHVKRKYPQLLEDYPIVYTGPVRDVFLDRFLDREDAR